MFKCPIALSRSRQKGNLLREPQGEGYLVLHMHMYIASLLD